MTAGQIARVDAVPHGAPSTVLFRREGLPVAFVSGPLHARAAGCAVSTPWVVGDSHGSHCFISPADPATLVHADSRLEICIEI